MSSIEVSAYPLEANSSTALVKALDGSNVRVLTIQNRILILFRAVKQVFEKSHLDTGRPYVLSSAAGFQAQYRPDTT